MTGKVWLVGAGPGDRGLFTLKGLEVLQNAQVVVYDALVGDEVLTLIPANAKKINVGKRAGRHLKSQENINQILLDEALAGNRVVRLKGGDPFVFGRGGEELELLARNHVPYEVVPGVTSAFAVPAYNGIPVTHRDFTSSVHVITGHRRKTGSGSDTDGIDFKALAMLRGTLIFLMGITSLPSIMAGLLEAGMDPSTPAAVLERGTTAAQRRILSTVGNMTEEASRAGVRAPAIIIVGDVCRLADTFAWFENTADRPLAGKKILITRPREQASRTAQKLRRLGAEVLEDPAIATVRIDPDPPLTQILRTWNKEAAKDSASAGWDWIVFTSPAGVRFFMDAFLQEKDIRALGNTRIAVIGEGSQKALRAYGVRADFLPSVYDGETLGKELGARISQERGSAADSGGGTVRILIPRAEIGNQELIAELEKTGCAEIRDLPVYRTVYAASDVIDTGARIRGGEIDYVVFTSASTVRGFCASVKDADFSSIRAVCIGRQTKAAAEDAGMQTRMAAKATLDDLTDAVVKAAAEDW